MSQKQYNQCLNIMVWQAFHKLVMSTNTLTPPVKTIIIPIKSPEWFARNHPSSLISCQMPENHKLLHRAQSLNLKQNNSYVNS